MEINVHLGDSIAATSHADDYRTVLATALERFQNRIRHVSLSLEDVNGPKRGIDKQCRCVLHLKRMLPIVIVDADSSLQQLVHRVADRAAYVVAQRTDKKFKNARHALPMSGPAEARPESLSELERLISDLSVPDWSNQQETRHSSSDA